MFEFFTKLIYKGPARDSQAHIPNYEVPPERPLDLIEDEDWGLEDVKSSPELVSDNPVALETAVGRIHRVLADSRFTKRFVRHSKKENPDTIKFPSKRPEPPKVRCLYTQLLDQVDSSLFLPQEIAEAYINGVAKNVGIKQTDLRRILGYFADIETLSTYNPKYDRGYGRIVNPKSVTKEQITSLVDILQNNPIEFIRTADEAGTYYADRLAYDKSAYISPKKETLGDKATSLYKEALSSEVVSQVGGFSNLVNEFGEKHALAIAKMASKYSSANELVRLETIKMKEYALRNPGSRILGEYKKVIQFFKDSTKQNTEVAPVIRRQSSYFGIVKNKIGYWTGLF